MCQEEISTRVGVKLLRFADCFFLILAFIQIPCCSNNPDNRTDLLVDLRQILPPQFNHTGHLTGQVGASQEGSFR